MYKKQIVFNNEKFYCSKTRLLKNEFESDMIYKSSSIILLKKIEFVQLILICFQSRIFLMHFDFKRNFFIDIDVFKKKIRRNNLLH